MRWHAEVGARREQEEAMQEDRMTGARVAAAFVRAQRAFGPALKTSKNPHFKSRYADLAMCVEAVIDALHEQGIALLQPLRECADGVTVETVLLHESGERLHGGTLHVPALKADPQAYGSAITYARRYSLMAACGIAPEDDDGNAGSGRRTDASQTRQNGAQQPADPETRIILDSLREAALDGAEALRERFAAIPAGEAKAAIWREHGESLKAAATAAGAVA